MASVDLTSVPKKGIVEIFGPMPTRTFRGEWAPVAFRKTQWRQVNVHYGPVEPLDLDEREIELFANHGLESVKKFKTEHPDRPGVYYYFSQEPRYTVREVGDSLGLSKTIIDVQSHLISEGIFIPRDKIYPHGSLLSSWDEKFQLDPTKIEE